MYNPQLETFLCVAEAGSFNKAAEKLYISPPAVIKQINLLEGDLACSSLNARTGGLRSRRPAVTCAGRQVHHPILQGFGDAGKKRHAGIGECHPHRHFADDTGAGAGRAVAGAAGGLSQHQIPACTL